jgi:hypothetical protein
MIRRYVMNELIKNLVKARIQEIEYLLDMNEIGRDLLPKDKIVELVDEKQVLCAELDANEEYVDDYDALMAVACR